MTIDGKPVFVGIPNPVDKEKENPNKTTKTHQTNDVYTKKPVRGKSKGGETGVEDGGEDKAHLKYIYRQPTASRQNMTSYVFSPKR